MYYQQSRPEMKPFIPQNYKTVLEIGCGEGVFKTNLHSVDEIWGIEPNPEAGKEATKQGYKVLTSTYDQCFKELPDNFFDLVICNDVIEHMTDHDFFFDSIKSKLTDQGALIGSIPNVRYYKNLRHVLLEKEWRYQESGILDRTHLRFFTEKSLRRTFGEHRFTIEKMYGINKVRGFKLFVALLMVLSLGTWSDIRFTQFGFRLTKS